MKRKNELQSMIINMLVHVKGQGISKGTLLVGLRGNRFYVWEEGGAAGVSGVETLEPKKNNHTVRIHFLLGG